LCDQDNSFINLDWDNFTDRDVIGLTLNGYFELVSFEMQSIWLIRK